jgi:hypothetical protein
MTQRDHGPADAERKEVYILRIYRRGENPPGSLVGIVEEAATGKRSPFHSGKELLERLERSGRTGENPIDG